MQSARSKATRKYEAKTGMITKSYKLKKEIVEEFKVACEKAGSNQSKELTRMMLEFIEKQKENQVAMPSPIISGFCIVGLIPTDTGQNPADNIGYR